MRGHQDLNRHGKAFHGRVLMNVLVVLLDLPKSAMAFVVFVLLVTVAIKPVAAAPNAVIQNEGSYVDVAGYYHIVGEVKNTGDVWLQFVRISATLKDQNGAIVDMPFTYTTLNRLPPDIATGFDLVELDTMRSAQVRSYSLSLEFQQAESLSNHLVVTNITSSKDSLGWLQILGEVQNTGDSISEYTEVIGTFYGTDGKVVDVTFTFTDPTTVQPGGQQPFKLIILSAERSSLVNTWILQAQSQQYTSVPELPWQPALFLAATILLSLLLLRGRHRTRIEARRDGCACRWDQIDTCSIPKL